MKISVCLATKNGQQFIKEQIDSILSQLGCNDELVISDDNSDDDTLSILLTYKDPRVKIYRNTYNNHVRNFEFTLRVATGDYIFLSDQDDVWMKNKVEVMLPLLKEYDMVVSNAVVTDESLNPLFNFFKRPSSVMNAEPSILKILRSPTSGCCMAFTRSLVENSLPFPANMYMHDRWLWAISCVFGKPLIIDDPLIFYRRHKFNFTNRDNHDPVILGKTHASLGKKIRLRYLLISNLVFKIVVFSASLLKKYYQPGKY